MGQGMIHKWMTTVLHIETDGMDAPVMKKHIQIGQGIFVEEIAFVDRDFMAIMFDGEIARVFQIVIERGETNHICCIPF